MQNYSDYKKTIWTSAGASQNMESRNCVGVVVEREWDMFDSLSVFLVENVYF